MTGLVRDRVTATVYGTMAVYGYFIYGFSPAVPLLRDEQGVSRAVSALHGTALAVGAVVAGLVGAGLVARCGRGVLLRAGIAAMTAGVVAFTASTALPVTLLGALVAGTAGSVLVNLHSPALTEHHGPAGPAAISEANAVAAGVGLLAPLALGLAATTALGWRAGTLLLVPMAAVVLLAGRRVRLPDPPPAPARGPGSGSLPRAYWLAWGTLVLCIAVEFSMTIWASDLLRERSGLGAGAAAAAITAIIAGMTLGRLAGGRLALRFPVDGLLLAAIALAAAGFGLFWASTVAWLAVLGLLVAGLGIALHFPLGIARAISAAGGRPDLAAARVSLGAGAAIGCGPFVLGALADSFGVHAAFLLVPAMLAAAAGGCWRGGRGRRLRSASPRGPPATGSDEP